MFRYITAVVILVRFSEFTQEVYTCAISMCYRKKNNFGFTVLFLYVY